MIVRRGKKYGVRVYRSGGRQEWVGTFDRLGNPREEGTARWAEAKALKEEAQAPHGGTCDEFAARWIDDYPRPSEATNRTYRYATQRFANDFKGVPLHSLDRPRARRWALDKPRSDLYVLRAMFNDALNDGLVTSNPFQNLRQPPARKRPTYVPTVEEVEKLGSIALAVHGDYGPLFRAMILFSAYTGMRPGEVACVRWEDIDLKQGIVYVRRNRDGTGRVNDYTKNRQIREALLPPPAAAALGTFHRLHSELVFTTPHGRMVSSSQRNRYWSPVRAAFGRPTMKYHGLRHFAATHLLELGVAPHDVAHALGHTDGGALVMNTYGHPARSSMGRLRRAYGMPVTDIREQRGLRGA